MAVHPDPPFFLFDGDCGFCRKWAGWLKRQLPADVTFLAYQDLEDVGAYGLTERDVETASYWIDKNGKLHRGARSFACALRQGDGARFVLGALLGAPVIGAAADRLYPIIARNRHRLPAPETGSSN